MKNTIQKTQQGFTLIELMIVVAIIGILASVAIPSYQNFTKKAKFSEVVLASSSAKIAVEMCAQMQNSLTECDGNKNGIPVDISGQTTGMVASVTTVDGKITVVPIATGGIAAADTYELTPTLTNGKVTWAAGGGCTSAGIC